MAAHTTTILLCAQANMGKPHALVIPFPYQGHVIPLMNLSHCLIDHGFKVTFVNTDYNHSRVAAALGEESRAGSELQLVSIPDGLSPEDDRNDLAKMSQAVYGPIRISLEELIKSVNKSEGDKITCVIADENMASAIIVADKMGIRSAAFWPAAAGFLALFVHIPELIMEGILDENGVPTKQQMIRLSPEMPEINTDHIAWNCAGDADCGKLLFDFVVKNRHVTSKLAHKVVCNSFHAIEAPALKLIPNSMAIGPLISTDRLAQQVGHFWQDDSTCLGWLDRQRPGSVVYVAFGSFTVMNEGQLHELALGLELTGRPFLWVVRADLMDGSAASYPQDYEARVLANQGKLVKWAPQQKVLAHPSIGCFVSHCGWNSITEGLSSGVPFLCWPYFCDQFLNQSYVCEVWKVGVRLKAGENGIITKEEIKSKVEYVMRDGDIKARAVELKENASRVHREGTGASWEAFNDFAEAMR